MEVSRPHSHKYALFGGIIAFFVSIELAVNSWAMFDIPITFSGAIVIVVWTLIGAGFGAYCDKFLRK